ncbi:MAG: hypothetical protein AB7F19_03390 [Candidatus Babeliales bacterium]
MKKLILHLFMACALMGGFTAPLTALPQKTVFTVDHDDVINTKGKFGITECAKILLVVSKIAWHSPRGAASLLWNWRAIYARGQQEAQVTNGATNVISVLAQELKNEGYPDLTPYTEEITAITINPTPIMPVIEKLQELKKQGYVIIGATNQDYYQNKAFRKKMAAQGVKLEELFDGVLVAYTTLKAQGLAKNRESVHELEPGIYMPTSAKGYKPNFEYFTALKAVARKYAPKAKVFVHTDDKLIHIQGAQKVKGFAKSLHFKLPEDKSARRCTKAELLATIAEWKASIEKLRG